MRLPGQRPVPREWTTGPVSEAVEAIISGIENPWSISPETGRALARTVTVEGVNRVLEFGAGASSRVLAAALQSIGGGRITSVEENPEWCEEDWSAVEAAPGLDAELIVDHVRLKIGRHGFYYGYGRRGPISRRGPFDLVFVDAPPGIFGRDGPLHAAFASLRPGALIILDDAARAREQRTLRRWLLSYPSLELVANDPDVGRGLAILRRSERRQRSPSTMELLTEVWASSFYEIVRGARVVWGHRRNLDDIAPAG